MLLQLGDDEDQPEQVLLVGHMAMSTPLILRGELSRAREHLDIAYAMCESGHGEALEGIVLETPGVWVRSFAGWNRWLLGDADAAARLARGRRLGGRRAGCDELRPRRFPRARRMGSVDGAEC